MRERRNRRIFAALFISFQVILTANGEKKPEWIGEVGATSFPQENNIVVVNEFGANNNGLILSTDAIQEAIDRCAEMGGGKVVFEPGIYLTGAVYVKSNVNLYIGKDVELRGIIDLEEYPVIDTRVAGIMMEWPSAIVNVINQKNAAVTGEGTIHGQGRYYWEQYWKLRTEYTPMGLRWASDYDCKRVRTILVSNSENITLKGLSLKQSGFWTVHVLFSSHITVDGVQIENNIDGRGPSTDGIDIDSSSKILVQNCSIDCNDDNICLKAGRDADGLKVNRPTEYIVIRNCTSYRGSGLLTIGSETSGCIRHVYMEDSKAYGTMHAIRLKSALTRGGGLSDIIVNNISMENVNTPIAITLDWNPSYSYASLEEEMDSIPEHWKKMLAEVDPSVGIPTFKNVVIKNIKATGAYTGINVSGVENSYLENFNLESIDISCAIPGRISYTKDWTLNSVNISCESGRKISCSDNINLVMIDTNMVADK